VFGATLTLFQDAGYYSAEKEIVHQAMNTWIRSGGAFDGVIDFDRAVRDPANPARMMAAYDSGDHLHPGDAGYEAMGNAVPLALFRTPTAAAVK
jgi:lysophospholipase L1-like esterase